MRETLLGVDIGGSSLKLAVVARGDRGTVIVEREVVTLPPGREPPDVLAAAARTAADLAARHGRAVRAGLAVPGLFDQAAGTATLLPNLPLAWSGYPVRDHLAAALRMPVRLINDARAFSLAEARLGAAHGLSTVVFIVLGTGVGGGVVVAGELLGEGRGTAGEIGHQTVLPDGPQCGCGNHGCVEALVSAAAVAELGGQASVAQVYRAAAAGDARARDAVRHTVRVLGIALGNAFTLLAPDAFVVGGGVAGAGEMLLDPLRAEVRRRVRLVPSERIRILPAALGRYAGAAGAALWAGQPD